MVKFDKTAVVLIGMMVAVSAYAATVSYFGAGSADSVGVAVVSMPNASSYSPTTGGNKVEERGSFNNITTKTTTVVKSGAGTLLKVCTNAVGTADTITVYDNTAASGTKLATAGAWLAGTCVPYNTAMTTGITVVTGGTTAGDYTVTYN